MAASSRAFRFAAAAALLAGGCGGDGDAPSGGQLTVVTIGPPPAALPPTALDPGRVLLTGATQVGLVALDRAGNVTPALARSWNISDDGRSYVFRLREDVRWADGRAMTPGDAVAVLKRVRDPAGGHPLAAALAPVRAVGSPAPGVVELRLAYASPYLLQLLAHPSLAIIRRGGETVAAGAFAVAMAEEGGAVQLAANPRYHDAGAVSLGGVRIEPARDAASGLARIRAGGADVLTGGTLGGALAARQSGLAVLRVEPAPGLVQVEPGRRAASPLMDERVRMALSLAADREGMVAALQLPTVQPLVALVPPAVRAGAQPFAPGWAAQPLEARRRAAAILLAEAEISPERPALLDLAFPDEAEHRSLAAWLARDWEPLGIRLRFVPQPTGRYGAVLAGGDYDLAIAERIAPVPMPLWFLNRYRCGVAVSGRCDPQADERLSESLSALGPERARLQREAEALMLARAPVIPLFSAMRWSVVSREVAGWTDNPIGYHPLSRLDRLGGGAGASVL